MEIAILGTGNIGSAIAVKLAAKGHRIYLGSRNPDDPKVKDLVDKNSVNISAHSHKDAIAAGKTVIFAIPSSALKDFMETVGKIDSSKLIIDCMNALPSAPEGFKTVTDALKEWSGSSNIVKAFNSTGAGNLAKAKDGNIDTFICGDHEQNKQIVTRLGEELGFNVIDSGDLSNAYLLESLALLWINLAFKMGRGGETAFKLVSTN